MNASPCLGLRFGIGIFKTRAALLEVDIQERPEEITLTSSVCFRLRFNFLLPNSLLWFTIFFVLYLFGLPLNVLLQFSVPFVLGSELCNIRIPASKLWLVWSFNTFVVGLTFPTVLPGSRTSYRISKTFFCLCVACILRAIFTCTLLLLLILMGPGFWSADGFLGTPWL